MTQFQSLPSVLASGTMTPGDLMSFIYAYDNYGSNGQVNIHAALDSISQQPEALLQFIALCDQGLKQAEYQGDAMWWASQKARATQAYEEMATEYLQIDLPKVKAAMTYFSLPVLVGFQGLTWALDQYLVSFTRDEEQELVPCSMVIRLAPIHKAWLSSCFQLAGV